MTAHVMALRKAYRAEVASYKERLIQNNLRILRAALVANGNHPDDIEHLVEEYEKRERGHK